MYRQLFRSVNADVDKDVSSSPGIRNVGASCIELWNICDNWSQERVRVYTDLPCFLPFIQLFLLVK